MFRGSIILLALNCIHFSALLPTNKTGNVTLLKNWAPPSKLTGTFNWVQTSKWEVPEGAVHGGTDLDGELYVGRVTHEGDTIPAKISRTHGCAFFTYQGEELWQREYEVLVSRDVAWKEVNGGSLPPQALQIGHTSTGVNLFSGRTLLNRTITNGKVDSSDGYLYVPWNGEELKYSKYEVLIAT